MKFLLFGVFCWLVHSSNIDEISLLQLAANTEAQLSKRFKEQPLPQVKNDERAERVAVMVVEAPRVAEMHVKCDDVPCPSAMCMCKSGVPVYETPPGQCCEKCRCPEPLLVPLVKIEEAPRVAVRTEDPPKTIEVPPVIPEVDGRVAVSTDEVPRVAVMTEDRRKMPEDPPVHADLRVPEEVPTVAVMPGEVPRVAVIRDWECPKGMSCDPPRTVMPEATARVAVMPEEVMPVKCDGVHCPSALCTCKSGGPVYETPPGQCCETCRCPEQLLVPLVKIEEAPRVAVMREEAPRVAVMPEEAPRVAVMPEEEVPRVAVIPEKCDGVRCASKMCKSGKPVCKTRRGQCCPKCRCGTQEEAKVPLLMR